MSNGVQTTYWTLVLCPEIRKTNVSPSLDVLSRHLFLGFQGPKRPIQLVNYIFCRPMQQPSAKNCATVQRDRYAMLRRKHLQDVEVECNFMIQLDIETIRNLYSIWAIVKQHVFFVACIPERESHGIPTSWAVLIYSYAA
jgi:hypothetical protein